MAELSKLAKRLLSKDASLWPDGNVGPTRLGWLDSPRVLEKEARDLSAWAGSIPQSKVVLLGMGGSSLGPAVLAKAHQGGREMVVLDTTHPSSVSGEDLSGAFILASSKSGTTLEVKTLLAHAMSLVDDPARFAVITDPGTPLESFARDHGFNRVFLNDPDIGGRYSVMSHFGMVPAALMGMDVAELTNACMEVEVEEAVDLGHRMGQASSSGQDKVTIQVPETFEYFGLWAEQIIAESTGKEGKGCIPVPTPDREDGADRFHIEVTASDPVALCREFFRFELATPIAGHVLGIDPFNEPNVAESKSNTSEALENLPLPEVGLLEADSALAWLKEEYRPGDYVSLQAYLPFGSDAELSQLRRRVRDQLGGAPVTVGYGPRFLHSTGQLHKGGPNTVIALQIVAPVGEEVPIPGYSFGFGTLISAQAYGDFASLEAHGRRVARTESAFLGSL